MVIITVFNFRLDVGQPFRTGLQSMSIAAVDVGSGYVKAISGGLSVNSPRVSFPSVVGEMPTRLRGQFGTSELPVIEYNERVWLTGQYALEHLRQHQVADTLDHNWAGSAPWIVLLLRALADMHITEGDVHLVTGVPQFSYRDRWRGIASSILGEHQAVVHGTKMRIRILKGENMVMPQAAAGLYYWLAQDASLREVAETDGLIGGIDVGTYTTGFAVLRGGRPVMDLCSGIDIGMSRVASTMGVRVHNKFGLSLDLKESMRMVENRHKVFLQGQLMDLSDDVRVAVEQVVSGPLMNAIYGLWGGEADRMMIGVYGGGAPDFFPFIQQVFPRAQMVPMDSMGGGRFLPVLGMLTYYAGRNHLLGM